MKGNMKNDDDEGEVIRDQETGRKDFGKPNNTITVKNRMKQEIAKDSLVMVYYHPGFDEWWIIQSEYHKNELVCNIESDGSTLDVHFKDFYVPFPSGMTLCGSSSTI